MSWSSCVSSAFTARIASAGSLPAAAAFLRAGRWRGRWGSGGGGQGRKESGQAGWQRVHRVALQPMQERERRLGSAPLKRQTNSRRTSACRPPGRRERLHLVNEHKHQLVLVLHLRACSLREKHVKWPQHLALASAGSCFQHKLHVPVRRTHTQSAYCCADPPAAPKRRRRPAAAARPASTTEGRVCNGGSSGSPLLPSPQLSSRIAGRTHRLCDLGKQARHQLARLAEPPGLQAEGSRGGRVSGWAGGGPGRPLGWWRRGRPACSNS